MKTRPLVVAAQAVDVSLFARSIAATAIGAPGGGGSPRSPHDASVSGVGPSRAQSPHEPAGPVPVHSLQTAFACSSVREPRPAVFVRYAVSPVPVNIVLLTTGSL